MKEGEEKGDSIDGTVIGIVIETDIEGLVHEYVLSTILDLFHKP